MEDYKLVFNKVKYWEKEDMLNYERDCIIIDTDGSCSAEDKIRDRIAGWGFVAHSQSSSSVNSNLMGAILENGEKWGRVIISPEFDLFIGASKNSNNTAELSALGNAFLWTLDFISKGSADQVYHFLFRSDSKYAVKAILGRSSDKENSVLIRKCQSFLNALIKKCSVTLEFSFVKGHSGNFWNDLADKLASKGQREKLIESVNNILSPLPCERLVPSSTPIIIPLEAPSNLGFQSILDDGSLFEVPFNKDSFINCFFEGLTASDKVLFDNTSNLKSKACEFGFNNPYFDCNKTRLIDYVKSASLPIVTADSSHSLLEEFNTLIDNFLKGGGEVSEVLIWIFVYFFHYNIFVWNKLDSSSVSLNRTYFGHFNVVPHEMHLIKSSLGQWCLIKTFKYKSVGNSLKIVCPAKSLFDLRFRDISFIDNSPIPSAMNTRSKGFGMPTAAKRIPKNNLPSISRRPFVAGSVVAPKLSTIFSTSSKIKVNIPSTISTVTASGRKIVPPSRPSFIIPPVKISYCTICGEDNHNKSNCLKFLSSYNEICCSWTPTENFCRLEMCKYIPKSCAELFQILFQKVIDTINFIALRGLQSTYSILLNHLALAFHFLPTLILLPNGKTKSISKLKELLKRILDSDCFIHVILLERETFLKIRAPKVFKSKSRDKLVTLSKSQELKVEDFIINGRPGKALDFINSLYENNSSPITDDNNQFLPEVLTSFHVLHPLKITEPKKVDVFDALNNDSHHLCPSLRIGALEFEDVINHLPSRSSNGLSSWSNDLLKFIINFNQTSDDHSIIFESLLCLVNLFLDGKTGMADSWINSLLLFIKKPDKVNETTGSFEKFGGFRPIAIDEPIIRLVGRCAAKLKSSVVGKLLSPLQMGVGIPRGVEYVVHAASLWIKESLIDTSCLKITIKVDVKNAFNTLPRWLIRLGVIKFSPDLLNYFDFNYGLCTKLVMINGGIIGRSETGLRQGDPLGPMFYALGIQIVLCKVKENFPNVDLSYFLDDGYLHGFIDDVLHAFNFLKNEMSKVNQIFDDTKCLVFGNSRALALVDHSFLKKSSEGLIILGCPCGTDIFINRSLSCLLNKLETQCGFLKSISNPLSAYNILKYCINTKGIYLARVCTPWLLHNHAVKFDLAVDNIIASWANLTSLNELSSNIRSLPYGLKLPKLLGISIPAWTNSFASALQLCHNLKSNHFDWCIKNGSINLRNYSVMCKTYMPNFSFEGNSVIPSQKDNTLLYYDHLTTELRLSLKNEKPLLSYLICMSRNNSIPIWLNWLRFKTSFKQYSFSNASFQHALRLRLLIHQDVSNVSCMCRNNGSVVAVRNGSDYSLKKISNMFHCLSCDTTAAEIKIRHDKISSVINNFLIRFCSNTTSQTEESYLCYSNGQRKNVDVIAIVNGRTFFIDVSIFNPGCPSNSRLSDESCFDLMLLMEKKKKAEYDGVLLSDNPDFIPFIVDTSGNLGPAAIKFISLMEEECNDYISKSQFNKSFQACISICLNNGLESTSAAFFKVLDEKIMNLEFDSINSVCE